MATTNSKKLEEDLRRAEEFIQALKVNLAEQSALIRKNSEESVKLVREHLEDKQKLAERLLDQENFSSRLLRDIATLEAKLKEAVEGVKVERVKAITAMIDASSKILSRAGYMLHQE
jgi:hypothetical protein